MRTFKAIWQYFKIVELDFKCLIQTSVLCNELMHFFMMGRVITFPFYQRRDNNMRQSDPVNVSLRKPIQTKRKPLNLWRKCCEDRVIKNLGCPTLPKKCHSLQNTHGEGRRAPKSVKSFFSNSVQRKKQECMWKSAHVIVYTVILAHKTLTWIKTFANSFFKGQVLSTYKDLFQRFQKAPFHFKPILWNETEPLRV